MTIARSLGSRPSSMSSFQTRNAVRLMASTPLAPQPDRRQAEDERRVNHQRQEVQPDDAHADAFQHDAAQRDDEIPGRNDVGDRPEKLRHARDRKDEARQQERREERRQYGDLQSDLL